MEMWFMEEMDHACYGGERIIVSEKGERERSIQENTQVEHFTSHCLGKGEGLTFTSSCCQRSLKPGVLKSARLMQIGPRGTAVHLERDSRQTTWSSQCRKSDLKNARDTQWGDYFLFLEQITEKQLKLGHFSGSKGDS